MRHHKAGNFPSTILSLAAYANGWYGGERTPENYAQQAKTVVAMGYNALKFDPFGTTWKEMNHQEKMESISLVEAVSFCAGFTDCPA